MGVALEALRMIAPFCTSPAMRPTVPVSRRALVAEPLRFVEPAAVKVRQLQEGGSWHVRVSLAQTAHWLRGLGRVPSGFALAAPDRQAFLETYASGFGSLVAIRPTPQLSRTPAQWSRPSVPPGTHAPVWP